MIDSANALQNFANSFQRGYLKTWKANGIMMTIRDIPSIANDPARLRKYLGNCLIMEGFTDFEVEQIAKKFEE
jgi:hypothetical protein